MLNKSDLLNKLANIVPKIDSDLDIYFEPFSMDGLEEMYHYSKDERLYEYFEFDRFTTIDETKTYIEKLLKRIEGKSKSANDSNQYSMYWFVRRKSDDFLIGTAGFTNFNYGRQSIEWGYAIDPDLWGFGFILSIQEALKKFTFEVLGLNRLHGITFVENERTIQSVLSSGMRYEGTLRDFYCKRGVYHNGYQYGMTAKDYHESNVASISVLVNMDDIISIISSILTEEEITAESSMENTLSWDSLNHMAIIIALKNQLSVDFSPSEIASSTSIKKIYKTAHEG